MNTFLITLAVVGIVIAAMAIGVMFGRKPIAGSCGGLGSLGQDCEFGCKKPCTKRQARMRAASAEQSN
ncbi:(Na+)-NQR maturation NqrM [Thauera aromatica]|uniref:Thiamine biosynthesis lipoprotein ApbE n=1 Tax=Thauera aromatica K172 TaxID=44139 RepID=A0A2R4BP08_THAAR|nr:(Na+)-NQR maturation NqrM [Thauera aromatica]AVR89065.1 thiamine biosynthesis lipoprotein ApbE [Thauera aromatica K172]